jgi:hypothetical protein
LHNEGNVGPQTAIRHQMRDLGERDLHILGLPIVQERAHVRADEEASMAIGGRPLDPEERQTRRQEMEELDIRRGRLAALKRLDQNRWLWTGRADKDAVGRLTISTARSAD